MPENGDINGGGGGLIPPFMPPTIAQQTYIVASGIAGGAAGMCLAYYLKNKSKVKTSTVIMASILSFVFTFVPALIIARESE